MIVRDKNDLRDGLWIPIIILQSIVALFSLIFIYNVCFVEREKFSIKKEVNLRTQKYIEDRKNEFGDHKLKIKYFEIA